MKIIRALCGATLLASPVIAAEEGDREIYDTFLSCAAFHTIEASRTEGIAAAAHQASAIDYAEAATAFAANQMTSTVNTDLETLLHSFKSKLDSGEPRAMAEQWTALESACRELHPLKDELVRKRKAEAEGSAPASR